MTFNVNRGKGRKKTDVTETAETAREAALRKRVKLIPHQGDFLTKEHLFDSSIAAKQAEFRAMNENKRLRTQLHILERKLAKKEELLKDSLNCTFIACPCTGNSKAPNMELIFTLKKKI